MSTVATILADIRKVAALIEPMVAVIAVAETATGLGGPAAEVAVQAIAAAIKTLSGVADGAVTHDQAMDALTSLQTQLAANDAAADAALAARFAVGQGGM